MNMARQIFELVACVYLFLFGLIFVWGAFASTKANRLARLACFVCGLVFVIGAAMAFRNG